MSAFGVDMGTEISKDWSTYDRQRSEKQRGKDRRSSQVAVVAGTAVAGRAGYLAADDKRGAASQLVRAKRLRQVADHHMGAASAASGMAARRGHSVLTDAKTQGHAYAGGDAGARAHQAQDRSLALRRSSRRHGKVALAGAALAGVGAVNAHRSRKIKKSAVQESAFGVDLGQISKGEFAQGTALIAHASGKATRKGLRMAKKSAVPVAAGAAGGAAVSNRRQRSSGYGYY